MTPKDQLASLPTPSSRLLPTIWIGLAIALLGILLVARPTAATASTALPQAHTSTFEGEWEEEIEEGEEGDEEWEETENEPDGGWEQIFEEEEELEEETSKGSQSPPTQCPLGSVKPQAFFVRSSGNLHVVLRYATENPTSVDVEFWVKGDRGPQLDSAQRQLNESGVLHLGRHLGQGKVDGPPVVIVQVKAPEAPAKCKSKVTKRLLARSGGVQASGLRDNRRAF